MWAQLAIFILLGMSTWMVGADMPIKLMVFNINLTNLNILKCLKHVQNLTVLLSYTISMNAVSWFDPAASPWIW